MKIMVISPYFYPKIGGVENYVLSIAKGLRDVGNHEVVIVTSKYDSIGDIEDKVDGLRVIRLPIFFKFSNTPFNPLWYFQLRHIFITEKPDVINAHSPVLFMADMAFVARGKIPFVLTYHSGSLKKGKSGIDILLGLYENTFLKYMLKKSTKVVSVYPAYIEHLIGKKLDVNYIPPGVDTNLFTPPSSGSRDKSTILYVGRIERSSSWKGIDVLLTSIAQVSQVHPDVLLRLVGDGDAIEYYKKIALNLGILDNIKFSGILRSNNLIEAYKKATMLILPSVTNSESFGIVLIEAMACGCPVIGSRIGGIPNVINDNITGILVPANRPTELAEAILKLISNPSQGSAMGQQGRSRVLDNFSLNSCIDKTNTLIKDIKCV